MHGINNSHQPPMRQGSPNEFQTPPIALNPLLPYLKKDWVIWECATGNGNLTNRLKELGYDVLSTDILTGHDFLTWQPPSAARWDCIVTNPPYSLKGEFLKRCYELRKPFALLLPLTILETASRQTLFRRYGVELILFNKRISFEVPSGKGSSSWFATMWVTWGLNISRQLTFTQLERGNLL